MSVNSEPLKKRLRGAVPDPEPATEEAEVSHKDVREVPMDFKEVLALHKDNNGILELKLLVSVPSMVSLQKSCSSFWMITSRNVMRVQSYSFHQSISMLEKSPWSNRMSIH